MWSANAISKRNCGAVLILHHSWCWRLCKYASVYIISPTIYSCIKCSVLKCTVYMIRNMHLYIVGRRFLYEVIRKIVQLHSDHALGYYLELVHLLLSHKRENSNQWQTRMIRNQCVNSDISTCAYIGEYCINSL